MATYLGIFITRQQNFTKTTTKAKEVLFEVLKDKTVNFDRMLKFAVTPSFPPQLRKETQTDWPFVQVAWKISCQ